MTTFFYLIRNGDLHKIGHAKNITRDMKQLKPDEIVFSAELEDPKGIEARLKKRYKSSRIPDTDYFRLNPKQIKDFKKQLKIYLKGGKIIEKEINIGLTGSFIMLITIFSICKIIRIDNITSICISLAGGSIPMWIIFLTGNFGGYDIKDLNIFSTWNSRLKAFLIAGSFSLASYTLWGFIDWLN